MPAPINTVEMFYAHALAIEHEAAERYEEFRDYFADRGEDVLAGLCANLAALEREHFAQLVSASQGLRLPVIPGGRHQWLEAGSPEAPAHEFFYRVAHPRHLLELALQGERHALAFFEWTERTSEDPAVRALAREMAGEEKRHVDWVCQALEYRASPCAVDSDQTREHGIP